MRVETVTTSRRICPTTGSPGATGAQNPLLDAVPTCRQRCCPSERTTWEPPAGCGDSAETCSRNPAGGRRAYVSLMTLCMPISACGMPVTSSATKHIST